MFGTEKVKNIFQIYFKFIYQKSVTQFYQKNILLIKDPMLSNDNNLHFSSKLYSTKYDFKSIFYPYLCKKKWKNIFKLIFKKEVYKG